LPQWNYYAANTMEISNDFKELFELFNKNRVEYVIVGGYALANLGAPRYTGDIDILIHSSDENAQNILDSLNEFGFDSLDLSISDFTQPKQVIQLGYPPSRIDILTSITGVEWKEINENAVSDFFMGEPVRYIGLEQYIKNKKAIGRAKDLADIEAIENQQH